jgi:hypothetical protein
LPFLIFLFFHSCKKKRENGLIIERKKKRKKKMSFKPLKKANGARRGVDRIAEQAAEDAAQAAAEEAARVAREGVLRSMQMARRVRESVRPAAPIATKMVETKSIGSNVSTGASSVSAMDDAVARMFAHMFDTVDASNVYTHINSENTVTGNGGEFVKGFTAVLDREASIKSEFLRDNHLAQVMAFRVRSTGNDQSAAMMKVGNDASYSDIESKSEMLKKLNASVPQRTRSEPSLALMSETNGASSGLRDTKKWVAALGDDGRVGLYAMQMGDNRYEHFLVVHVGQTQASRDLQNWVHTNGNSGEMRVSELIGSAEYRYVRELNRRNAQRLAVKAANALGVSVDTVEDASAHVDDELHDVRPRLAVPTVHDEYNVIVPLAPGAGVKGLEDPTHATLVGADATDVQSARKRQAQVARAGGFVLYDHTYSTTSTARNGLVVMQAPQAPLIVYARATLIDDAARSVLPSSVTRNAAADSFPVSFGKTSATTSNSGGMGLVGADVRASSVLPPSEVALVDRRVTWENKNAAAAGGSTGWHNSRVADSLAYRNYDPTLFSDASPDAVRIRETVRSLCSGSTAELFPFKLVPVAVKISSDCPVGA